MSVATATKRGTYSVRTHQGLLSLPLVSGGYVHLRPSLILAVVDDDVPGHKCDVVWSIDDDGSRYACTSPVDACSLDVLSGIKSLQAMGGRR